MTKEIEYKLGNETIMVRVTILKEFEDCKEDMGSPFKFGEHVLHPDIDPQRYEKVVIKFEIPEEYRIAILKNQNISGESIGYEVIDKYIQETWPNNKLVSWKSIFCTHYEQQYKYLIGK